MITKKFETQYLDLIEFENALEHQHDCHAKVSLGHTPYILGLEHPTVMTLGLRAHKAEVSDFCRKPFLYPVHKISRGGLATIHNPGQLVIYPIVDLKKHGLSVKGFVESLFNATQLALKDLGIHSTKDVCDQPGVYTSKGKIAFCGLQIKNGITLHGLSINITNDISMFNDIQACGVSDSKIDSVAQHQVLISPQQFFTIWLKHFDLESGEKLSQMSCEV